MLKFYLGLDLGQAQDYTALCVLERINNSKAADFHVRHLKRFHLGTSYPAIVERVKELMYSPEIDNDVKLIVDATGVGRPVVDLLRDAGLRPVPVNITAGNIEKSEKGYRNVPKRNLVSNLQVLLQSKHLKFAGGLPEADILVEELLNFQVKITTHANDIYGAWREGVHDDLVLSVALAAWYATRHKVLHFYHGMVH